ncbi:hypothetical protein M3Y99_00605900 [Aphelenchoides fujianensis]|nr:hypothetical protein M3Y99_00605900 [Aphelenchoides fujianensis]
MALIYASAVNKRMNAPRQKRSLAEGSSCMETSYTSHCRQRSNEERAALVSSCIVDVSPARERDGRKRSTSQHSGTNSSCACTPPPQSATSTTTNSHRDSPECMERSRCCSHHSIKRSKTTVAEMKRKMNVQNNMTSSRHVPRKTSTPIMAQSMYEPTLKQQQRQHSAKNNLRKTLAKKRLVQENGADAEERVRLAVSDSSSDLDEDSALLSSTHSRRRSLSADVVREHIDRELQKQRGGSSKVSAFQKMCNRFQKWSFHPTAIKSQQN